MSSACIKQGDEFISPGLSVPLQGLLEAFGQPKVAVPSLCVPAITSLLLRDAAYRRSESSGQEEAEDQGGDGENEGHQQLSQPRRAPVRNKTHGLGPFIVDGFHVKRLLEWSFDAC